MTDMEVAVHTFLIASVFIGSLSLWGIIGALITAVLEIEDDQDHSSSVFIISMGFPVFVVWYLARRAKDKIHKL